MTCRPIEFQWQKPKNKRLTIRLNEDHFNELEALACREGSSSSFIVRHLVIRYLEDKRRFGQQMLPITAFMKVQP